MSLASGDRHLAVSHYPSWGSGTPRAGHVRQRRGLELITPHGDRELVPDLGSLASLHPCSLPLMGIGNPPYSASFAPSTPRKRLKIPL